MMVRDGKLTCQENWLKDSDREIHLSGRKNEGGEDE
jgi:hypothetical protein